MYVSICTLLYKVLSNTFPPPLPFLLKHCSKHIVFVGFFCFAFLYKHILVKAQSTVASVKTKWETKQNKKCPPPYRAAVDYWLFHAGFHTQRERDRQSPERAVFSPTLPFSAVLSLANVFLLVTVRAPRRPVAFVRDTHTHAEKERDRIEIERRGRWLLTHSLGPIYDVGLQWTTAKQREMENAQNEKEFLFLMKKMDRLFTS